jgi:hypothetical protein
VTSKAERRQAIQKWLLWLAVAIPVAAVLVYLVYLLIWYGPDVLARHDIGNVTGPLRVLRLQQARDAARGRLLTLGAGLFAAGALIFTARNSLFAQRTAQATQRTVQLTEQGLATDRYTKAIEQLGSDKLDVRIGGIYALERIMVDSPRDHPTIVEVLAAFIRERAPTDPASWEDAEPPTDEQSHGPEPPADMRAAVTVIGRRPADRIERGRIDLHLSDLRGIDLYQSNLAGTRMPGVDLRLACPAW